MERVETLNNILTNSKRMNVDEKYAVLSERKILLDKAFSYRPEQMDILRKTNEHLIKITTEFYNQICKLQTYLPTIVLKNEIDGFSHPYIAGEVYPFKFMTTINNKTPLPVESINSIALYSWGKDDMKKISSLDDFLYQPFPKSQIEQSAIDITRMADVGTLCYGMYNLLFDSNYSLLDLMDKILFGYEVEMHTDKVVTMNPLDSMTQSDVLAKARKN